MRTPSDLTTWGEQQASRPGLAHWPAHAGALANPLREGAPRLIVSSLAIRGVSRERFCRRERFCQRRAPGGIGRTHAADTACMPCSAGLLDQRAAVTKTFGQPMSRSKNPRQAARAKKNPAMSGVFTRVIVVVANSVSVSAAPWWSSCCSLVRCFYFCFLFFLWFASSGFDVCLQMSNTASADRNLFCAQMHFSKSCATTHQRLKKHNVAIAKEAGPLKK